MVIMGGPIAQAFRLVIANFGSIQVLRGVEDGAAYGAGLNNTTTARDLGVLLGAIATGRAASRGACDSMLAILGRQEFNEGIPVGVPPGTRVSHPARPPSRAGPRSQRPTGRRRRTTACSRHWRPRWTAGRSTPWRAACSSPGPPCSGCATG